MEKKYNLSFIKGEYGSSLVTSEYVREAEEIGLLESERKLFSKYLEKTFKILDVGCGAGRVCFGLLDEGYKNVEGCDIASGMIKEAKNIALKRGSKVNFFVKDICSPSFAKEKYDAIIFAFNGLMCIPGAKNREKAVKNISKMLKKGGIFIFSAHDQNMGSFVEFFKEEKERWENKTQNKRLLEFGDIEYPDKFVSFLHVPNFEEVKSLLERGDFKLLERAEKNAMTKEENLKKEKLGNFVYYVAKKE